MSIFMFSPTLIAPSTFCNIVSSIVSRISDQRVKISSKSSIFNVIALFLGPPKVCEFVKLFFKSANAASLPIWAVSKKVCS